jgi:hypothetical protein
MIITGVAYAELMDIRNVHILNGNLEGKGSYR